MPPITCDSAAPVRPVAVVNAELRELASLSPLSEAERGRMVELWAEYRAAIDAEEAA